MMPRQTSIGTCPFCQGTFSKGTMTRHLSTCKQRQAALQVHCPRLAFKISPAEVACRGVKPNTELRAAFRGGKLDVHIPPIDTLLQGFDTLVRA